MKLIQSKSKQQKELITTGLGGITVGLGIMFTLFPGFMSRRAGFDVPEGPGRNLLVRLLGMRDFALGIGLLLNRSDPKAARIWLNLFALVTGSDILVFGIALPRAKSKFKILFAMLVSAGATALALMNNQE
jgi:hypothetical protein